MISSVADLFEAELLEELRGTWGRTLGPFVAELPDVEAVLEGTRNRLVHLLRL